MMRSYDVSFYPITHDGPEMHTIEGVVQPVMKQTASLPVPFSIVQAADETPIIISAADMLQNINVAHTLSHNDILSQ